MNNENILIIGDLHIGARNNSQLFLDYMRNYFQNELFPLIKSRGVTRVIQLGDTLDKRKSIDFITSAFLIKEWLTWFDENNVELYSIIGNHDTYYKSTNELSGVKQYESLFKNVHIITNPIDLAIGDTTFRLVPWICPENKEEIHNFLKTKTSTKHTIICGHFELAGFNIHKNFKSKNGTFDTEELQNFDYVFSGHFHSPSRNNNIEYVGTPYWLTWNDYGDKKKVIILNTLHPLKLVDTVFTEKSLFHKFVYQSGESQNISVPEGSYIKLIVNEPDELLDVFVNDLTEKFKLTQCQVIDMTNNEQNVNPELDDLELDDPFQILMKSIESIKDPRVSSELLSIYKEAQTMEK